MGHLEGNILVSILDDIKKDADMVKEPYVYMLGKKTKFIMFDFCNRSYPKFYQKTKYYLFDCSMLSIDGYDPVSFVDQVQLPYLSLVIPIYRKLVRLNLLNERNLVFTITRKTKRRYEISVTKSE